MGLRSQGDFISTPRFPVFLYRNFFCRDRLLQVYLAIDSRPKLRRSYFCGGVFSKQSAPGDLKNMWRHRECKLRGAQFYE